MPAAGGEGRKRLPRSRRLTRREDIRSVLKRGKRSRTAHLDVFDSASPVAHPRVGLIVPKHRQRVVDRNRLKRRLREILRVEILPRLAVGPVVDVLVRARREAYGVPFTALRDELTSWVERRWPRASCS